MTVSSDNWFCLTIHCSPQLVDAVGDYLLGVVGAAVEFSVEDRPGERTVHGFLQLPGDLTTASASPQFAGLGNYLESIAEVFQVATPTVTLEPLPDSDWTSAWKKHFIPFAIIPGLIIKPTWEAYTAKVDELVIEMDPGMAFGTGHHATTAMCVEYLGKCLQRRQAARVLDIGTGTGILAMAAAHFGAAEVVAIDNDPEAVAAAAENIARNGFAGTISISTTDLAELSAPYDIIVANIICDVLLTMVGEIRRLTSSGGEVILSGLLSGEQVDSIIARYQAFGFNLVGQEKRDEWAAVCLRNTN